MSQPPPSKQPPTDYTVTHTESTEFNEAEVFANALELDDLAARKSYLDQFASLDTAERLRLERLLIYSCATADFLEPSNAQTSREDSPRIESVGDWLGPYRLLQQIGEGGMGTVFMAEQVSPLQRRVAIKVIKPGMDSSQVLARFEAERQALALMEHPNIARAIDVGVSSLGRTYFVMELVKGIPITRYCDDLRLSTRQRLELFIPVCLGIQHAHQKGIIHRDLKPSNIMVAEYDGVPVPKVIDFGVAKATNQQLTCKTLFTQFGQIIGTMEYMSPEQSRVNQLDIDTRSDIYSLGILLYELMTGTTPIQSQDLKELSWDALAKKIREEDAPSPSQRLSTIECIQVVAQQRSTDPAKLSGIIKGELDWIILKSLEKQRSRRYQNATELAEDIQRYLRGEEVLACPPSTSYRIRKYFQKHKLAFVAGGLVTAALVLGLAGTSWQAWNASAAREQAERQRDIANAETLRAQEAQAKARFEAEKSAREAEITQAVANFVNNDLIAFADPNLEPDRDVRLREIIDRASDRIASLNAAPLVEASIRYTLAKSYLGLGEYRLALGHAETSWKIRCENLSESHSETLAAQLLVAEAELKLSRFSKACETFDRAAAISSRSLSVDSPITLDCQHGFGVALARIGKLDAAKSTLMKVAESRGRVLGAQHAQTLDTDRELAEILFQQGDYLEASKSFELAIASMTQQLGESHPLTLKTMAGAANVASELGEIEEARSKREVIFARQNKVLGAAHPDTLLTASNLTLVAKSNREPAAAIARNVELMQTAEEKLGATHTVTQSISLAIAELLMDQGRASEAIGYLEKSKIALQDLHQGLNPEGLRVQFRIASCLVFEGRYRQALDLFQQTLNDQQSLLSTTHLDTLKTQFAYAYSLMTAGEYRQAEEHLLKLIATARDSDLKNHPLIQLVESKLATLECVMGRASSLERHQAACNAATKKYGPSSAVGLQLSIAYAESLLRFGRTAEAKRVLEESLAIVDSHYGSTHPIHGQLNDALIEALAGGGEFEAAIKRSQQLFLERQAAFGDKHPLTIRNLNQQGVLLVQSGNPVQGVVLIRKAVEGSRENFGKDFPQTLTYQQNLASTLGLLSISDRSLRKDTLNQFEQTLSIQAAWGVDHPDWLFTQLGYAGALGQQGRFMQAERIFETLLPKLIKTYGESHPLPLRCRENYSSVLGSLGKHQAAIEQCRACIRGLPTGSLSARKVIHAAIEYHISSGEVLSAMDLYDAAFKIASEPKVDLDWLFLDVPYFADAFAKSGEHDKAITILENAASLFSEKLGRSHPKSLYLSAKLLSLYQQSGQAGEADLLLERLVANVPSEDVQSLVTVAEVIARIAKKWEATQGLQITSLYGLAAQASLTAKDETVPSENGSDYQKLAIKALSVCAEQGQLRSLRSQHWLKHSTDLDSLRESEGFKKIVAEVEKSTVIENAMRLSWNFAIVGDHQEAAELLQNFAAEHPELTDLASVHYLTARTWARCYEAADSQGLADAATKYLERCESSLQSCAKKGYFESSAERLNLANDDNFENVRDKISSFASYSIP